MPDSTGGTSLLTSKANSKERGCGAGALSSRPETPNEEEQFIAEFDEILAKDDMPDELVQKCRVGAQMARVLHARKSKAGQPQNDSIFRRVYDSVIPASLDGRRQMRDEDLKQELERLESRCSDKAWQAERKKRRVDEASLRTGTLVFWLIVFVLVVTPLIMRARMKSQLSRCAPDEDLSECRWEVLPYPRLALWCALAIVTLFKLCSLDMSRGPWGAIPTIFLPNFGRTASQEFVQKEEQHALPRVLTGAVPESQRSGAYGFLERLLAIWHGLLGSYLCGVLLLMSFSRHMSDNYTLAVLTGEQLQDKTVILAQAGTLDDKTADLSRCLAMQREDVKLVEEEYFGMRNLLLFMLGAVLFGMGELFKLRSVQDSLGKNYVSFESLLRISKPWIWSQKVRQLKGHANALVTQLQKSSPAGDGGETLPLTADASDSAAKQNGQVDHAAEAFSRNVGETAQSLMHHAGWYNFGQLNFWRVVWAAVFQLAGAALWVPASLPELMPCLHQTSTWSVAQLMVTDAVDISEIISFGSVCALVAIMCLIFALFLIPYELHMYSVLNPFNWPVKIKFLQGLYQATAEDLAEDGSSHGGKAYQADHWLRLVVDGCFPMVVLVALLFGEMGAPSMYIDPTSGWSKEAWKYDVQDISVNPWALWRIQVGLITAELAVRWIGNTFITGKSRAMPSVPEEAAYAAQVQGMLLEIVHQVADVAGGEYDPDPKMDDMLRDTSHTLRLKVYDEYESALERRAFTDREYAAFEMQSAPQDGNSEYRGTSAAKPQEFIVDNRWLKAQTDGLGYRNSPDFQDQDATRPVAPWYSTVYGYDLENGWVEVEGGGYLPAFVGDTPVLTIPDAEQD